MDDFFEPFSSKLEAVTLSKVVLLEGPDADQFGRGVQQVLEAAVMDSSRHRRKQASQGSTLVHGKSLQILGWLVGTTIVTAIVLAANSLFY